MHERILSHRQPELLALRHQKRLRSEMASAGHFLVPHECRSEPPPSRKDKSESGTYALVLLGAVPRPRMDWPKQIVLRTAATAARDVRVERRRLQVAAAASCSGCRRQLPERRLCADCSESKRQLQAAWGRFEATAACSKRCRRTTRGRTRQRRRRRREATARGYGGLKLAAAGCGGGADLEVSLEAEGSAEVLVDRGSEFVVPCRPLRVNG